MKIEKKSIKLKIVSKTDYSFLYQLLKERESNDNISHKKIPTYAEHLKFVKSKPYSKWYVVYYNKKKCGTIYITELNEIAFHLKKEYHKAELQKIIINLVMEQNPASRYLANISPKNKDKINFFKKNGFKIVQFTYELIPEEN
ncbi:N-acetyltransferase [Candidatus Nitrosopelagicus sp.]|nr:N-acetyltransferase [Candidatus Nitrosopelagicus sp.]